MNFLKILLVFFSLIATSSYANNEKKDESDKRLVLDCNVEIKNKARAIRKNENVQIILQEGGILKTIGSSVVTPVMHVSGDNFSFYFGFNFEHAEGINAAIGWHHEVKSSDYELRFKLNRLSGSFEYYWNDKFNTNEAIGKCRKASNKF